MIVALIRPSNQTFAAASCGRYQTLPMRRRASTASTTRAVTLQFFHALGPESTELAIHCEAEDSSDVRRAASFAGSST